MTEAGPLLLYLITSRLSSVLLRGQLSFLIDRGYRVVVGVGGGGDAAGQFDEGVETVALPFIRRPSPLADLHSFAATMSLIRRLRPALVNASTPKAGLIGMTAAVVCRVPVRVYVVRGLPFETAKGWRRALYRVLDKLAAVCATHVIFNSDSLRKVALDERIATRSATHVLGSGSSNGVCTERFAVLPERDEARDELGLPLEADVVGYVGRLAADKGVPDLVRAFTRLSRDHRPLWLLVVGSGTNEEPLDSTTRRLLEDHERIVCVPWLDDPRLAYSAMDVLALPSYREGLPNVALEAQLCGLPVVGYAATGTVDAVQNGITGLLVPVGDADALSSALSSVLHDGDFRRRAGRAAIEWVKTTFDQERVWSDLADRYDAWLSMARR